MSSLRSAMIVIDVLAGLAAAISVGWYAREGNNPAAGWAFVAFLWIASSLFSHIQED